MDAVFVAGVGASNPRLNLEESQSRPAEGVRSANSPLQIASDALAVKVSDPMPVGCFPAFPTVDFFDSLSSELVHLILSHAFKSDPGWCRQLGGFMSASKARYKAVQHALSEPAFRRDIFQARIRQNPMSLEYMPRQVRDDDELVALAVGKSPYALKFASDRLRSHREHVVRGVVQNPDVYRYRGEGLAGLDARYVDRIHAIRTGLVGVDELSPEERADKWMMLAAVGNNGGALRFALEALKGDRDVVLAAVCSNGLALEFASETLRNDRDLVVEAVKRNGRALRYASEALREDRGVVVTAVLSDPAAIDDALTFARDRYIDRIRQYRSGLLESDDLTTEDGKDKNIILAAIYNAAYEGWGRDLFDLFEKLSTLQTLWADREFVLDALSRWGFAIEYAPEEFKQDRDVVLTAISAHSCALRELSDLPDPDGFTFHYDFEIVMKAVTENGFALEYASEDLKADRDIVLAAVTENGCALEYASEELKEDRDIVLVAVKQDGLALEYASEDLKDDRDIVLVAVKQEGLALEYASESLQDDRDVVLAAVDQNPAAIDFASARIRNAISSWGQG